MYSAACEFWLTANVRMYTLCFIVTGDDILEGTNDDNINSATSASKLSQIFMCLLNVLLYDERRAITDKHNELDKVIEDDKFFDNAYFAAPGSTDKTAVSTDTKATNSSRDAQREMAIAADTTVTELSPDTDTILSGLKGSWSLYRASCLSWQEAVRLLLLRREKLLQYKGDSSSDSTDASNTALLGTHIDAIGECRRILVHVMKAAGKDVTVTKKRCGRPRKATQQTAATADTNDAEMDIDDIDDDNIDDDSSDVCYTKDDVADLKTILLSIDTGWYNTYSATSSDTTATITTVSGTTDGSSSTADTRATGHAGIAKDVMNYLTALAHEAECDIDDDLETPEAIASQEFIDLYNKRVLQPLQFAQQHHKRKASGNDDETDDVSGARCDLNCVSTYSYVCCIQYFILRVCR
jgi:hypothetical protein